MTNSARVKIGLEIHCQLTGLKSKLFCACKSNYRGIMANANTCPTCTGLPGTLPILNKKAVEFSAMVSMALHCKISNELMFYRKNYFYPDSPKNFQITQYNAYGITSIGVDGSLGYSSKSARIRRIQLEEDPGRLVYDSGNMETSFYSLIDYNRAGVALVEIVTEPDFTDPKDVRIFLNKLTSIVEHLGICDTNLEGSVRCDANVSIVGGQRVEIKNVSSFKEVEKALNFEIARQKTMTSREIEIKAETRHWDDARKVTKQSRAKEEEQDYRYFPDPDIPSIILPADFIESLKRTMPELPDERKLRFIKSYNLSDHVSQVLIDNKQLADFFEDATKKYYSPKEISNWIVTELLSFVDDSKQRLVLSDLQVSPGHIAELASLIDQNLISRSTAKNVLGQAVKTGEMPSQIVANTSSAKIIDVSAITEAVNSVFSLEKNAVMDANSNPNAANFLLGKVMQLTKGRADPRITLDVIKKRLQNQRV